MRSFLFLLNLEVSSPRAAFLSDGEKFGLWMGNISQKCFTSYISVAPDSLETFLHLCAFRENQEISRVGPRLTCGQSVNCKPMMFLQPTERRASPSRNVSHKSLLLPGWALGRIYSCSLSSTLPTIITLELEHQHLATLAICKKKCALCMLRTKTYTKSLIFQFQSI